MYGRYLKLTTSFYIPLSRFGTTSPTVDHYAVLGVKPDATAKEIKTAYYSLSKQHHPDANPDNKEEAIKKFHELAQAYEVLGSDEQRKIYDMTRIRTYASTSQGTMRRNGVSREKEYTDVDIDYKTFEQFQRNTRRRRQFHSHFEMPNEFYAEFGGKRSRVFKSEYEQATENIHSMYKDSRAAQREQEELQREIQREQEEMQKKYPIPTFEQLIQEKRQKEAIEQKKYLASLLTQAAPLPPTPMLATILLPFIVLPVYGFDSIYDRNRTKNYVLKKTWVQNFVLFEYSFDGKQGKPKIVPLGCVPSNKEGGKVIQAGETFTAHDFVFGCEQGEDGVFNYEAIACVDAHGTQMAIGETRRLSNGTVVLHCNIFGGALKKVVERAAGCYFNETIYGEDQLWIEPLKNKTDSALTGILKQCFRPHNNYFESHIIGCAIGRLGIRLEEFTQLADNSFVQCRETDPGVISLFPVTVDALSCRLDNSTFPHDAKWEDSQRAAQMHCSFGHVLKTSCLLDGQTLPIGQEQKISNGCVFLCHPQSNVYICDTKLADFQIVEPDTL